MITIAGIAAISLGGALGALSRHGLNTFVSQSAGISFPIGILTVNVVGCFLMGALIASFVHIWNPSQEIKLFLTTGFLGAFTTFSAFSLDVMTLIERGQYAGGALYVAASVALSIMAVFAGFILVKGLS